MRKTLFVGLKHLLTIVLQSPNTLSGIWPLQLRFRKPLLIKDARHRKPDGAIVLGDELPDNLRANNETHYATNGSYSGRL
jgi:hypothetical protein